MPFAGYKNFDDCVRRNRNKKDPKAYCATIMRQAEEGQRKMFNFKRFIPISKVDDDKRMVYGWASTPALDSDGEIVALSALKNALPSYLQFPTIREMHQPKAAGTTKNAEIVDGEKGKGLYIGAKIVADDAWDLVKEGVYKGFSIGGHIVEKVENVIQKLDLVEISLVDVPANKEAIIEVWKSDGGLNKAVWNTAYINDLPDSAFAYIEPGGKKDDSGKTVPRSLRHFPHHDKGGAVDLPHLRNALARAPQSPFGDKALGHLKRHASAEGVGEGNKKFAKDADGMIAFAQLLDHAMAVRSMVRANGKNTKQVDKMIEQIKAMAAAEAGEAEQEQQTPMGGIMRFENAEDMKKEISVLEKMDFGEDKIAEALRKGVIIAMQKKVKELAKDDEPKAGEESESKPDEGKEEETSEAEEAEGEEEAGTESEEKEESEEESAGEETSEGEEESESEEETGAEEEEKETSETPTLTKVKEIDKKLDKLAPKKVVEKLTLEKTVQAMASTLDKVASILGKFEERLAKVESTPARLKSKAVFVHKSSQDEEEESGEKSPELVAKEKRHEELVKLYNELGPAEFAKRGYSLEAMKLEKEINELKGKGVSKE